MTEQGRSIRRRPTWLRIVGALAAAVICYNLVAEHSGRDVLSAIVICPALLVLAIAPRWLYDGRGVRWAQDHRIVSGALVLVFMGGVIVSLLADSFSWRVSLSIGVPASLMLVGAAVYADRRRGRRSPRRPPGD